MARTGRKVYRFIVPDGKRRGARSVFPGGVVDRASENLNASARSAEGVSMTTGRYIYVYTYMCVRAPGGRAFFASPPSPTEFPG